MIAVGVFVFDDTLLGSQASLENHREIFRSFCFLSPGVRSTHETVLALSKTKNVFDALHRELQWISTTHRRTRQPVVLYLCLNGHSYLYRDQEAIEHAKEIGETPFLARDGSTVRFSTFRYGGKDLITPTQMKRLLEAINASPISRTILFLDTCHSMSLVSVLLCPPMDIRILHSSGEDEKTWQDSQRGSIMSLAWAEASREEVRRIKQLSRTRPKKAIQIELEIIFWKITQGVASRIVAQVLTTGPGQSFTIF